MILAGELSLKQLQRRRNLNKNSGIDGIRIQASQIPAPLPTKPRNHTLGAGHSLEGSELS